MTLFAELWGLFMPWIVFIGFVYLFIKMIGWAKKGKAWAFAFGLLVQMFLPDPKVLTTIEAVAKQKQEVKKQQAGDGEPLKNDADNT